MELGAAQNGGEGRGGGRGQNGGGEQGGRGSWCQLVLIPYGDHGSPYDCEVP